MKEEIRRVNEPLCLVSDSLSQARMRMAKRGDADTAIEELTHHYRKVAALIRRFVRQGELAKDAPSAASVDRNRYDGANG